MSEKTLPSAFASGLDIIARASMDADEIQFEGLDARRKAGDLAVKVEIDSRRWLSDDDDEATSLGRHEHWLD